MRHPFGTVAIAILIGGPLCAQPGPQGTACTYALTYTSLSVQSTGGTNTVGLNTQPGCGWSASVDVPWITIVSGTNGSGSASIGFAVIANTVTASRTGNLTVQGQKLAITQVALLGPQDQVQQIWTARAQVPITPNVPACSVAPGPVITFLPTDAAAYTFLFVTQTNAGDVISDQYYAPDGTLYANAGGSYTVLPGTQSLCFEDQGMKIVGAPPANMPGLWTVNVKINGVLVITTTFTIAGSSNCAYTLTPASLSIPAPAANGYVINVVTTAGCAWTVANTSPWMAVTGNASGIGSGMVIFSSAANYGDSRTAYITIGGQVFAVTQVAVNAPLAQITQVWMTHTPFPNSATLCSDASTPATTFAPTDAAAYLFLSITQAQPGDVISDQYFAPDGTLYTGAGGSVAVKPGVPFACWEDPGIAIRGAPPQNMTGVWNVKVMVDGVLMITTSFAILPGTNCTYSISPISASVPATGGTGTIAVTADPGCSWTASTNAPWLHLSFGPSGTGNASTGYSVDANVADTRTGTLLIAGQTFTVTQQSGLPAGPAIAPAGVSDPWTFTKGLAPGAWVTIFGSTLSNSTQSWSPTPNQTLPTTLAGVSVTVDGIAAVPSYVSPTQVNVLVPAGVRLGDVPVVVTNNGIAGQPVMIASAKFLPAIYSNPAPGTSPPRLYVTAVDPIAGQLVGNVSADPRVARNPRTGDTIDLYAAGLGPTMPSFPTDVNFTGNFPLTSSVNVILGGVSITPAFASLVAPGLYQMRITIPSTLPQGDQPILLDFGGGVQSAQNVFLTIQH